jgi:protein SCO1
VPLRARLALLLAASFVCLAAFVVAVTGGSEEGVARADGPQGALRPQGIPPTDFEGLVDERGRPARLADSRGRPTVVTFLYTTCEDTCPTTAQQVRIALDRLGRDVPVVAIAVDPPRDTPARARRFLAQQRLAGRMRFLTGPRDELERQWRAYGIQPQGEDFEHSAHVVLLDGQGVQRIGWPVSQLRPEGLAADIALLERSARRAG